MKTSLFSYELPLSLIAQTQASPRDSSRLMVINKNSKKLEDRIFSDLPSIIPKNSVLVFNDTKVFPARIFGKKSSGGKMELLLLDNCSLYIWNAIGKPGLSVGQKLIFKGFDAEVIGKKSEILKIKFSLSYEKLLSALTKTGLTPLPPYIKSSIKEGDIKTSYQTVYAKRIGSSAAPTAGFHFSKRLLKIIKSRHFQLEFVTLHVGLGTFAPVKTGNIEDHKIHSEYFSLTSKTVNKLNQAKKEGKKIIAVGTTTTRVLESCSNENGVLMAKTGKTSIFIYPPYKFRFVDGLITNFHLPQSTLLALVSAFVSYPNTKTKFKSFKQSIMGKVYEKAINNKYRFYSFGDSSIII